MKKKESKATSAQKALRLLALLAVIGMGLALFILLFSFVPMLFLDTGIAFDSGGILDRVLLPVQHGNADLPAKTVFFASLPLQTTGLFAFLWMLFLDLFVKRAARAGRWLHARGRTPLLLMCVFALLLAAVPKICSVLFAPTVAASGSYRTIPWNPLGGILLFVFTTAAFAVYSVLLRRRQAQQGARI